MTNYVLKDNNNGYLKEFDSEFNRGELTIMTTDLQKAFVFNVHSSVYKNNKSLFDGLEVAPVKVDQEGANRKVTTLNAQITPITQNAPCAKCVEPSNTQIGGNHYQQLAIQPVEYIHKNNLSYNQGNVVKYITRYKDKNGLQDLQKAKHYIDLIIQFEYIDKQ